MGEWMVTLVSRRWGGGRPGVWMLPMGLGMQYRACLDSEGTRDAAGSRLGVDLRVGEDLWGAGDLAQHCGRRLREAGTIKMGFTGKG